MMEGFKICCSSVCEAIVYKLRAGEWLERGDVLPYLSGAKW